MMDHDRQTKMSIEIAQIESTKQALMRDLLVKETELKVIQQELQEIQRENLSTQIKAKQEQSHKQLHQQEHDFKAKRTFQKLQLEKQVC